MTTTTTTQPDTFSPDCACARIFGAYRGSPVHDLITSHGATCEATLLDANGWSPLLERIED